MGNWLSPSVLRLVLPVLYAVVIVAVLPLLAGYIVLMERKVMADMQARLGPMRVGPHGLLQPIAPIWCEAVRRTRYLFIIKAILKDSKVVVCWIVKAFARTSASSS